MARRRSARTARAVAFVALGSLTTLVLLPIAINVGTGGTAPGFLADYQGWLWPAVGVLFVVSVVLGAWDRLREKGVAYAPGRWNHPANRRIALERVQGWVESRMRNSLGQRAGRELDLALLLEPDMVLCPEDLIPETRTEGFRSASNEEIARLFEENHHGLLILGEPGGGKSTLLLNLCVKLIDAAVEDPERPIPVVVDLVSWSSASRNRLGIAKKSLSDFPSWLVGEIVDRYELPKAHVERWLRDGGFVLLLDGLDEVEAEDRESCVEQINRMSYESRNEIAVCSRVKDYLTIKDKLRLYQAVRIEPLGRAAVLKYLDDVRPHLDEVRRALESTPRLWEVLNSPLVLNIMALTYHGDGALGQARSAAASLEPYKRLFDDYVVEMLARGSGAAAPFSTEQVIRGLKFLARMASNPFWNDLVVRTSRTPRVAWLDFVSPIVVRRMFARFEPGVVAGVAAGTGFALGTRFGVVAAAVVVTCLVPYILWLVRRYRPWSTPPDVRRRGWHEAVWTAAGAVAGSIAAGVSVWIGGLLSLLVGFWPAFLVYLLVLSIAFSVAFFNFVAFSIDASFVLAFLTALVPAVVMLWTGPSEDLVAGIGSGLVLGAVVSALVMAFNDLWDSADKAKFGSGNSWIWWGRLHLQAVVIGAVLGLGVPWLSGALVDTTVLGSLTGLAIGLAVGPIFGNSAQLSFEVGHGLAELLARPLAFVELPVRRRALLVFATKRILLTESEGEYRFVHALVRDHLSECDPVLLAELVHDRVAGGLNAR